MSDEILPSSPAPSNAALLDAALTYAARGWSIIPVIGKRSPLSWKQYQQQPADEATLRQMFAIPGITGLAVIVGHVSGGLACRDYDEQAAYDQWAASHPNLARTLPTVATARGRHVYFSGSAGFQKLPDGEYRATAGQYCLLPPSRHPDGIVYRWVKPLPDGELPVVDPAEFGLCNTENAASAANRRCNTENAANTANSADTASAADTANTADSAGAADTANSASLLMLAAPAVLQAIEFAIDATLASEKGQRHQLIFHFARHLKAIPALRHAEFATLRPFVREWHRRALPIIGTKPFVESWADFVRAWKRVIVPAGEKPVQTAFELAKKAIATDPPLAIIDLYGEGPIVLLAMLCQELQRIAGDKWFFLDCRTAGRLIGVDYSTAWRYLDVLCADGVLVAGSKGSKKTGQASKFRFINRKQGGAS